MAGNGELAKYLLGSGALTVLLLAFFQAITKLYENRTSLRRAKSEADSKASAESQARDAAWNALYRHSAERHLPWDLTIQGRVQQHETLINELRRANGEKPIVFPPIPPPPPLWPEPQD